MVFEYFVFKISNHQTVIIAFNCNQIGLVKLQALKIPEKGRILNQNRIPRVYKRFAEKIHCLG